MIGRNRREQLDGSRLMIPQQRQRFEAGKHVPGVLFAGKGGEDKGIVVVQKIPGHAVIVGNQAALIGFCQDRRNTENKQHGQDAHDSHSI